MMDGCTGKDGTGTQLGAGGPPRVGVGEAEGGREVGAD